MRGHRALVLAMVVVAVGVLATVGAYLLDPARAAVGPMPGVGMALPAQTRMVSGLDVRRVVKSPAYRLLFRGSARPQAFTELQARTGINPERDLEDVLLSSQAQDGRSGAVAIVSGHFDRAHVAANVEKQAGVSSRLHEGRPVYVFHPEGAPASALAFLEDDVLALGSEAEIEQTVTAYVRRSGGLKDNPALVALVQSVRPGSAFWAAGDGALLGALSGALPQSGGLPMVTLPGLKSVVLSAEVDPTVSVEAVVQAADEKAAQQISGLAAMMIGLARMQGGSDHPEMQQIASAIAVTTDKTRVRLNARFSDELLEALQKRAAPRGTATPAPPPAARPDGEEPPRGHVAEPGS